MQSFFEKHAPTLLTVALLLVWEGTCRIFTIDPFVLPMPSAIWDALIEYRGPIWDHAQQTFWTTMVGLVGLSVPPNRWRLLMLPASVVIFEWFHCHAPFGALEFLFP